MKFLLFLLAVSFYFIFYFFLSLPQASDTFFGNIFFEAHFYMIIGMILILKVLQSEYRVKNQSCNIALEKYISPKFLLYGMQVFFSKYLYYIAAACFYFSLYLLIQEFFGNIHISQMFFIFQLIIIALYSIEHKFELFQNLLRVNALVICLYYTIFELAFIGGLGGELIVWDVVNIALLIGLFMLFLWRPRSKISFEIIASYSVFFVFLQYLVVVYSLGGNLALYGAFLSIICANVFLFQEKGIAQISGISLRVLRIWGLLFSYVFFAFWGYGVFFSPGLSELFFIVFALFLAYKLFVFHQNYENFSALFFASFGLLLSSYSLFQFFFLTQREYYGFFFLIFGFFYIALASVFTRKYPFDRYFFQAFSLLVNIFGVILFFLSWDFSVLYFAILLLFESCFLFSLYYIFRKN